MRSDAVVESVALTCGNIPREGQNIRVTALILAMLPKSSLPG